MTNEESSRYADFLQFVPIYNRLHLKDLIDYFLEERLEAGIGESYSNWEIYGLYEDKICIFLPASDEEIEIPATVLFFKARWDDHFNLEKEQQEIKWKAIQEQKKHQMLIEAKEVLRQAGIEIPTDIQNLQ